MDVFIAIVVLLIILAITIRVLAWLYGRFLRKYDIYSDGRLNRKIERHKKQMELAHLKEDLRQKKEGFDHQFRESYREDKRLQLEEKKVYNAMSLELAKLNIDSHNGELERLQSMIGAMLNFSGGLSNQKHLQTMSRIEALRALAESEIYRLNRLDETQRELEAQKFINTATQKVEDYYSELQESLTSNLNGEY
jgi:hypothetical protein